MKDKLSILVADDNVDFAKNLTNYIEREEEMEVIGIAKDGLEAIDMIRNAKPDIAIIDVIMPQLDGLGVLERINEFDSEKKPLCIVLSAVGQEKITTRALELGAEYYIVKPVDISILMKRIKDLKFHKSSRNKKVRDKQRYKNTIYRYNVG